MNRRTFSSVDGKTPELLSRRAMLRGGASLAAAVGSASVAACGPAAAGPGGEAAPAGLSKQPATLTYLHFFRAPDDPQNVLFPHALEVFQQKHPQINVDGVTFTEGNVMEKFLAMISAGTAPDLAALNPQFVEPLRARSQLADLTTYIKRDAKTFKPEDLAEPTVLRAQKNGKWHAIPLQMGLWFLLYNANVLQQAGVKAPDKTWTWDRLLEAVRTVRSRETDNLGMTMPPYELPVRGNGGDVLSADEKKCLLDQPQAVEAVQWNADLRQKYQVVPHPADIKGQNGRQLFDNGRYAFFFSDPGFLSRTQRGNLSFKWDIAVVPKGKVAHVSTVKGPSLVMTQDSKLKDATWAWLSHYTGVDMQRWVAVEAKIVSARKSALKAFVDVNEGYNKQAIMDTAAMAKPLPYIARYDEMNKEINTGLNAAYDGKESAKTAMSEVARKVNDILATITN